MCALCSNCFEQKHITLMLISLRTYNFMAQAQEPATCKPWFAKTLFSFIHFMFCICLFPNAICVVRNLSSWHSTVFVGLDWHKKCEGFKPYNTSQQIPALRPSPCSIDTPFTVPLTVPLSVPLSVPLTVPLNKITVPLSVPLNAKQMQTQACFITCINKTTKTIEKT